MKQLPALALVAVLTALTSCGPSAEERAAIAACENGVREKAEVRRSVSFGQILHDHNLVMREVLYTGAVIHGEFTQQAGDRFVVPHFYTCVFGDGKITLLNFYTGHAADYDKAASRAMCLQAIELRSEAVSAHFKSDMPESASGNLPSWEFRGTVRLLNASGSFSRHRYSCRIYHGEVFELELTEED